jgi:hypothetical protein
MAIGPELTCNSCKKRVPLGTMRYAKDGSGLICEECLNRQNNGGINLKAAISATTPFTKKQIEETPKKKVSFTCTSCRFKYARALDFRGPKSCPNCGKDTVVYNLPNNADALLKELDEMDDI